MKKIPLAASLITLLLFADAILSYIWDITLAGDAPDALLIFCWCVLSLVWIGSLFHSLKTRAIVLVLATPVMAVIGMILIFSILGMGRTCYFDGPDGIRVQEIKPFSIGMPVTQVIRNLGPLERVVAKGRVLFGDEDHLYTLQDATSVTLHVTGSLAAIDMEFKDVGRKSIEFNLDE